MLEVQLQQQQDAAKQASESKRQRDSDKVLSLERQVSYETFSHLCGVMCKCMNVYKSIRKFELTKHAQFLSLCVRSLEQLCFCTNYKQITINSTVVSVYMLEIVCSLIIEKTTP